MAMANKAVDLSSIGSLFPSVNKPKKSSTSVEKNFRVSRIPSVKAVQSPVESATGRLVKQRRSQNVDGDFFVGKYHNFPQYFPMESFFFVIYYNRWQIVIG